MSTETITEYEVKLPVVTPTKFEREKAAFYRLLPELLKEHAGKYIAIHDEKVVAVAEDRMKAAKLAWDRVGYCDIFAELVSLEPRVPSRLPHVREVRQGE